MKFYTPRYRQRGFSILEISIGIIIGSIALFGFLQATKLMQRSGKTVTSRLDFDSTGMTIVRLLSDSGNCTAYFQNQEFLSDPATLSSQVIGETGTPLSIFMPGTPTNIIAKEGETIVGTLKANSLTIRGINLQSPNNYLAKVRLQAEDLAVPKGLPLVREFGISMTTADVPSSSPAKKKIVSCSGMGGAGGSSSDSNYFIVARHSFSTTAPSCPAGWDSLWTGFSFMGVASDDDWNGTIDMGSSGSCMEEFKPIPFIECSNGASDCDYVTGHDFALWLRTYGPPGGMSSTPSIPSGTWSTMPDMLARVSRCSVCGKSTSLLVRHKTTGGEPATSAVCPSGWSSLWEGYSYIGGTGRQDLVQTNLGSVGSCLEHFIPVPFIECKYNECSYNSLFDVAGWLTVAPAMTDESVTTGYNAILPKIARCQVCERNI